MIASAIASDAFVGYCDRELGPNFIQKQSLGAFSAEMRESNSQPTLAQRLAPCSGHGGERAVRPRGGGPSPGSAASTARMACARSVASWSSGRCIPSGRCRRRGGNRGVVARCSASPSTVSSPYPEGDWRSATRDARTGRLPAGTTPTRSSWRTTARRTSVFSTSPRERRCRGRWSAL